MPPLKAISTLSLGSCQYHSMRAKLEAAVSAGFTAIDLFDTDWDKFKLDYAREHGLPQSTVDGDPSSVAAAKAMNSLCASYDVRLLCLQPFREFEARRDPTEAAERMHAARGAVSILPALGSPMLLIPSSTLPPERLIHDVGRMAAELGELADYAAHLSPDGSPLRICYEALSWGTFVNTWKHAWEVIKLANRPNLGLCLDSFNTAAREWADPYHPSGVQQPIELTESALTSSHAALNEIPSHKIFYFQVADGKLMTPPLILPTDPTIPPLRPWSRSSRLFPLEVSKGAYLPVVDFAKAVVKTGYSGPWALEVFNDSLNDSRPEVPSEHATRGIESLTKLFAAVESGPEHPSLTTALSLADSDNCKRRIPYEYQSLINSSKPYLESYTVPSLSSYAPHDPHGHLGSKPTKISSRMPFAPVHENLSEDTDSTSQIVSI